MWEGAVFEALDADGSGFLEYAELNTALRRDDVVLAAELQVEQPPSQ